MTRAPKLSATRDVEQVDLSPHYAGVLRGTVLAADLPAFLGRAFAVVAEVAGACGATLSGPPYARYTLGPGSFDIAAGFPVDRLLPPVNGVELDDLPGGPALRIVHVGAYDEVGAAYDLAERWLTSHGKLHRGQPWESYVDDPEVEHPRTIVYVPFTDGTGQSRPVAPEDHTTSHGRTPVLPSSASHEAPPSPAVDFRGRTREAN